MSAFDELFAKLAEKNLNDMEVEKIVNVGIGLASALGGSEDVLAQLDSLKKQAEAKKQNKDIKYIDGIDDMKDMRDAVNNYNARNDKGFANYDAQALMADKLADLSEKADGKEVYNIANNLMKDTSILENGTKEQKETFAGCLCTAYAFAADNGKLTPKEALVMLDNVDDLAMHTQYPDMVFSNVATCLDDKKVAERFVAYTEKVLNKMGENNQSVYEYNTGLIDAYTQIVQNHPEMAGKCSELVNKTVNMVEGSGTEMIGKAIEFCDKVNEKEGVHEAHKSMARVRSRGWRKEQERIEKSKSKDKSFEKENDDAGYQYEMAWHSHTTGGMDM